MSTVCQQCGSSAPAEATGCPTCGAAFTSGTVVTSVLPDDTTGLPPGGTFGPTIAADEAPTFGGTAPSFSGLTGLEGPDPLKVGSAFGPRYQIIRLLGSGGMGQVYLAWDQELAESVALKVIRPEYASNADADARFKRELSVARQVTHKNVVRIHDLGQVGNVKFISMSFIEGEDLA